MSVAKKNVQVKAIQTAMAKMAKENGGQSYLEWEMTFNTNGSRPNRKVWDQAELKILYDRDSYNGATGATKLTHTTCHNGNEFENIVIKRFKKYGWDAQGNQLTAEIDFWQKYADTEYADYLCPIFKFFTSKSDKVSNNSETMKNNVMIIAQKASKISNAALPVPRLCFPRYNIP